MKLLIVAVAVAGLTIHIRCGGERKEGAPLIVLEAGAGYGVDTWRAVQAPIAQVARVCARTIDRRRGTSKAPANSLTPIEYVELLQNLLNAAGERAPYVLVGRPIPEPLPVEGLIGELSKNPGGALCLWWC